MQTRLTFDQVCLEKPKPLYGFDILADLGHCIDQLAAIAAVASDVHDVRTGAEDVVCAGREDN